MLHLKREKVISISYLKTLIDADVVDSDTGADTLDIVDETHLAIITHHMELRAVKWVHYHKNI